MTLSITFTMPFERVGENPAKTAGVSLEALRKQVGSRGEFNIIDSFAITASGTLNDTDMIGKDLRDQFAGAGTAHKFVPFTQGDKDFNVVLSRIEQLTYSDDDFTPTDYAYRRAISLIYEAYRILDRRFARAAVASDEDGSISIYWRKPEKTVELSIAGQEQGKHYIYHRENRSYGNEYTVTAANLARWLVWFKRT